MIQLQDWRETLQECVMFHLMARTRSYSASPGLYGCLTTQPSSKFPVAVKLWHGYIVKIMACRGQMIDKHWKLLSVNCKTNWYSSSSSAIRAPSPMQDTLFPSSNVRILKFIHKSVNEGYHSQLRIVTCYQLKLSAVKCSTCKIDICRIVQLSLSPPAIPVANTIRPRPRRWKTYLSVQQLVTSIFCSSKQRQHKTWLQQLSAGWLKNV